MVLPLIGCKEQELLYISCDEFDFIIKGKPCHPGTEMLNKVGLISNISILCKSDYRMEVLCSSDNQNCFEGEATKENNYKYLPLFYEYQNYEIVIENKGEKTLSFWHENNLLREKVSYVGRSKKTLSGVINFGSDIGFTEFKIYVDGNEYLRIILEVFPSKIDYNSDYISILNDVNEEIYNLAFDFLKKTYLFANTNQNVGGSLTEFYSIIKIIFDRFKAAIDTVLKTPHHVLQKESQIVQYHKLRKINSATIKWLEKNPQYVIKQENGYTASKALAVKKSITFDTYENRFIKYIMLSTAKKIEDVRRNYIKLGRRIDDELIKQLEEMKKALLQKIEFSFLKDVQDIHLFNNLSLVLNMAPGYKDLYKYYLILCRGLSLNGEIFRISVKDLALLYEYWCFIKLNSIMKKNKYKLVKQDLIKVDNTGLFVTLSKGRSAKVTYENRYGEKITLTYNPTMKNIPTVSQRPDSILSLEKNRSRIKYEYIFDAKYRINPALEGTSYRKAYGQPGPEEDDINTMHRYRDAIVRNASNRPDFERTMFGAYILFPYSNEEEYRRHTFYKSIDKVNIGGLPFLPSATKLVEKLLEELIEDSPESAFERTVLPSGTYDYVNNIDFGKRDILVGVLSKAEQLKANLEYKFYHIPYSKIAEDRLPLNGVALYQSSNIFKSEAGIRYYGEILSYQVVKRKDITEIPTTRDGDILYYKFKIKEWRELEKVIKPKELGVRANIYTNMFLLQNAEYVPELLIKSKEEYRLYMELKRLANEVNINARNVANDDISCSLNFDNCTIAIEDQIIKVFNNERYREFKLGEFISRPRTTMLLIKNFINER